MKADFKPIHFFNHSTNESFQIVCREGLMNFINDCTENHSAFNTYEELKERCFDSENPDKYQSVTSDNADYFVQEEDD